MCLIGQVKASESLFTYPEGRTAADYAFPEHRPIIMEEISVNSYSPDLRNFCEDNPRCLFDSEQTGIREIGGAGLAAEKDLKETVHVLCKF